MKTLGMIGGLGPESTVDYYQRIIALYRERRRDGHYPEFIIVSVDLRKGLDFMDAKDLSGMANYLLEGIGKLERAEADFYPKVFKREGIELHVPDLHDQNYIHDKYFSELVSGNFFPETRAGLLAIVDRMKATSDIEGVILAGTELPLILRDPVYNGIPFLDTTKIHVEAAVDQMLS